jgi:hypothetical protein
MGRVHHPFYNLSHRDAILLIPRGSLGGFPELFLFFQFQNGRAKLKQSKQAWKIEKGPNWRLENHPPSWNCWCAIRSAEA